MGTDEALLADLIEVGRAAVAHGLAVASGGNLSARIDGASAHVVTAAGTRLDRLTPADFVALNGPPVGPGAVSRRPSTESAMHRAVYAARPDVGAVIHLHPQATLVLDAVGERIRLITTDHAVYVRRVVTTPFHPPGSSELADAVGAAVADGANCVILPLHGCCVIGPDVRTAWQRMVNLEEAARLTYRALLLTGGVPGREIAECPLVVEDNTTV